MDDVEKREPPPPPPQPQPSGTITDHRRPSNVSATGAYSRRGGDDLTVAVWALGGPITLTFISSIIQAAAGFSLCQNATYALFIGLGSCTAGMLEYAMSLGVISACIIAIYILAFTFVRAKLPEKSMLYVAGLLFVWWTVGVAVTTFSTSLTTTTTLYFATWSSFVFSGLVLHSEWEQFRAFASAVQAFELQGRAAFYTLIASIINLVASIVACSEGIAPNVCIPEEMYSIVVSAISCIICLMFLKLDSSQLGGVDKFLAIFLVVWWTVGMAVETIRAPFVSEFIVFALSRPQTDAHYVAPGNGLFSAWAAYISSFFIAQAKIFPSSENA